MGLEPEGTRQSAGGALQPEAAFAAAKVESLQAHHSIYPCLIQGVRQGYCFYTVREALLQLVDIEDIASRLSQMIHGKAF